MTESKPILNHGCTDAFTLSRMIWKTGWEKPTDGTWQYVVKVVRCKECENEAHFQFAYFKDDKWLNWNTSEPIEVGDWEVFTWINIELFEAYGFRFDFGR